MGVIISMLLSGFSVFVPIALLIALQVYLARMNQKWIGLILPIVTGIIASFLLYIAIMSGFSDNLTRLVLFIFVFYFPTLVLLVIYLKFNKDKKQVLTL